MKLLIQYLFLCLTILAFSGAQASAANSGHMLDNIELIPGEKTSYLTLKGYFEPELFQEISIRPGESAQETLVVIPNAFINNLLMPDREFNQFPVGNMIRQIELEEDIRQEAGNQVSFLVNLKLSLAQELEISLEIEKSTPRQLTFSLIPSGRLITPEPEKTDVTDVLNQTPLKNLFCCTRYLRCLPIDNRSDSMFPCSMLPVMWEELSGWRFFLKDNNAAGSSNGSGCGLK